MEKIASDLTRVHVLQELITVGDIPNNPLVSFKKFSKSFDNHLKYDNADDDIYNINKIHQKIISHPIVAKIHNHDACTSLTVEIELLKKYSYIHNQLQKVISNTFLEINNEIADIEDQERNKNTEFETLLDKMIDYKDYYLAYKKAVQKLVTFNKTLEKPSEQIGDHILYYDGDVKIDADMIKSVLNQLLKNGSSKINDIDELKQKPERLYSKNFNPVTSGPNPNSTTPTYNQISERVFEKISGKVEETPRIRTKWGDFEELSPGLKSAVILDIVMQYNGDHAPIIIDQPEDNLSIKYINETFVKRVKDIKKQKQVILVSHNATIPMIGDAQNIIYCENKNGRITIRSAPLEGEIDGEKVVDLIARITDGGKVSVKKRFKKYNLKRFNKKEHE